MELSTLLYQTQAFSVLKNLRTLPLVQGYLAAIEGLHRDASCFAQAYGALAAQKLACPDATALLRRAIHTDDNVLTAHLDAPSDQLYTAASHDLTVLTALLSLPGRVLREAAIARFPDAGFVRLPDFDAICTQPFADGQALTAFYRTHGWGFFAQSSAFMVSPHGALQPLDHPDPIRLSDLPGYEHQKQQILQNTRLLLEQGEANNLLLYGDKGTGKSSTIKAVANEYAAQGLKIIELPGHRLAQFVSAPSSCPPPFEDARAPITHFAALCDRVRSSPFSFVLFLDDLSFTAEDDSFAAMKTLIEGGLSSRPRNLALYATGNRRHLICERHSDRQGDAVSIHDTLQTATALSDRFGLEITFSAPDKDEYLHIVHALAVQAKLNLPEDELDLLAERYALRRNGRSPRTAQHFVRWCKAQQLAR